MIRTGRNRGFTLIELLVVVVILAILAGIMVSLTRYASERAERGRAIADLQQIAMALEEHRAQYGGYPQHDAPPDEHVPSGVWVGALWRRPQEEGRAPFLRIPALEGVSPEQFDDVAAWLAAGEHRTLDDYPHADFSGHTHQDVLIFVGQSKISDSPITYVRTARDNPLVRDPWGLQYQYRHPSYFNNPGSRFAYDLWSYGPGDPDEGYAVTRDDPEYWIANWKGDI